MAHEGSAIRSEGLPVMSTVAAAYTTNGSYISSVDQRLYKQSNLLGSWKGTMGGKPITLKVTSIKGSTAQVEFDHGATKEHGTATVSQNTLTYGSMTIGTKNGTNGVMIFTAGTTQQAYQLTKDTTADQPSSKLVGTWSGSDPTTGAAMTFNVKSVDGKTAQVVATAGGNKKQTGTADVMNDIVRIGYTQISSSDGKTAHAMYKQGNQYLALTLTKQKPTVSTTA
ncbi:MAG: hypothetical protein P4L98_13950 [Ancalomicrobiaceae bacterium]|nr:hypothetical protein [Ancalomicrobiaceae bacterium]